MSAWFHCAALSYGPCLCKPTAAATSLSRPPAMTLGHKCQERKADVTRRVRLLFCFCPPVLPRGAAGHILCCGGYFYLFIYFFKSAAVKGVALRGTAVGERGGASSCVLCIIVCEKVLTGDSEGKGRAAGCQDQSRSGDRRRGLIRRGAD